MIDINPTHLETIEHILAEHVPDCEVRAFGSRVTWTAKDYSDLDLVIVGQCALDSDCFRHLKEAFEESDLPFRVDVLDWNQISESFHKVIEKHYEVIQKPAGSKPPSKEILPSGTEAGTNIIGGQSGIQRMGGSDSRAARDDS